MSAVVTFSAIVSHFDGPSGSALNFERISSSARTFASHLATIRLCAARLLNTEPVTGETTTSAVAPHCPISLFRVGKIRVPGTCSRNFPIAYPAKLPKLVGIALSTTSGHMNQKRKRKKRRHGRHLKRAFRAGGHQHSNTRVTFPTLRHAQRTRE